MANGNFEAELKVRVPAELKARVVAEAKERSEGASVIVREALREYFTTAPNSSPAAQVAEAGR